jgi:glutamine cyclotransferase
MIAAMRRTHLAALAGAILATGLAHSGTAQAQNPVLIAKVGLHNSYRISLRTPNGQLVQSIPTGTYSIVVHDYSKIHNFALGSQTDNKRLFTTGIRWVGTKTYTLTFTPGNYAYACSAHFRTMNGTFTVTSS